MSRYSTPRPITQEDAAAEFDSGEPSLDEYLRGRAHANHARGASNCYVTTRGGQVVGYYALAAGNVFHHDLAGKFRRQMPDPIPVLLLTRLAVDLKEQGHGLGGQLLRDAISRCVAAAHIIGVRAILVHAIHARASEYYAHFGFEPSPTDPLHLLLLMKDARALVGR